MTIQIESEDVDEAAGAASSDPSPRKLLWDRKTEGGFPEVKELKRRVRDVIDPQRDLGHVDRGQTKVKTGEGDGEGSAAGEQTGLDSGQVRKVEEKEARVQKAKGDEEGKQGQEKQSEAERCEDCK